MLECNYLTDELGISERLKDVEKIIEKKLTYVEAIHVDGGALG